METAEQNASPRRKPGNPNWRKGVSANPAGRESAAARRARREAMLVEIANDIGCGVEALSFTDRLLLTRAIELLDTKPTSHVDRVRAATAGTKLLQQVRERHPRREPLDPWSPLTLVDPHEHLSRASPVESAGDPATPLAGERNGRAGERPCESDEPFEGEGEEGDAS
jgi:hypothetical protein